MRYEAESTAGTQYTFYGFEVTKANRNAFEKAKQFSVQADAKPLAIFGGTASGKTHLLYAIRNAILQTTPELNVMITTTAQMQAFLTDILQNGGSTAQFRAQYEQADALLVDDVQALAGKIAMQEQLILIFNTFYEGGKRFMMTSAQKNATEKLPALHGLCQHTGDVWKCFDFVLTCERYHLRTAQKRLMVKLFESYPVSDFTENLILSNRKRERTLLLLKYLDYNEYSRSPQHHQAVADLRSDKLRSWESRAKYLVEQHSENALDYIAERPGMLLRWVTYLLRNGYASPEIGQRLCGHASSLKIQTVVSVLTHFAQLAEDVPENSEASAVSAIMREVLRECLSGIETLLRGKKVFLDFTGFDPAHSTLLTVGKSAEGGYIRSGLSYTIPEDVRRLRFFVYWNDQRRVDVDLHGTAVKRSGREVRIGWNADFRDESLAFSGDITHSDAAEYIDVDLDKASKELSFVKTTIDLYYGYPTFRGVDVCYVGCMAVKNIGEEVQLYDPANCFFTHFLTGAYRSIGYGFIDIAHRCITFVGNQTKDWYDTAHPGSAFSLADYDDAYQYLLNNTDGLTREMLNAYLVCNRQTSLNGVFWIAVNYVQDMYAVRRNVLLYGEKNFSEIKKLLQQGDLQYFLQNYSEQPDKLFQELHKKLEFKNANSSHTVQTIKIYVNVLCSMAEYLSQFKNNVDADEVIDTHDFTERLLGNARFRRIPGGHHSGASLPLDESFAEMLHYYTETLPRKELAEGTFPSFDD